MEEPSRRRGSGFGAGFFGVGGSGFGVTLGVGSCGLVWRCGFRFVPRAIAPGDEDRGEDEYEAEHDGSRMNQASITAPPSQRFVLRVFRVRRGDSVFATAARPRRCSPCGQSARPRAILNKWKCMAHLISSIAPARIAARQEHAPTRFRYSRRSAGSSTCHMRLAKSPTARVMS